jgi:hypothetical protein
MGKVYGEEVGSLEAIDLETLHLPPQLCSGRRSIAAARLLRSGGIRIGGRRGSAPGCAWATYIHRAAPLLSDG